jgi:hypothetical protein
MRYFPVLIYLFAFAACKKELRTKTYVMDTYQSSGITGTVSFIETNNKNEVTVQLKAEGLIPNTVYLTHLHTGTPGNLTNTLLHFHDLQTTTTSVMRNETWTTSFDEALESNTCFTMHNPDFFSNDTIGYVLSGGTGRNGR